MFTLPVPKLVETQKISARNLTLVIMETGTHPGFLQILSPVSQCDDEPSRNSSSRLERGSFMRVEPEERVSFATHRGLLCLNEQQRVRVASSEHLPLFPIDRTNERRKSELDSKIRVAFASQIRLDKINKWYGYKVQENRVTKESEFLDVLSVLIYKEHWQTLKIYMISRTK